MKPTAVILHFPRSHPAAELVQVIGAVGFTGEPVPNIPFSDELQEKLLVVLDEVFDSNPDAWLGSMLRAILASETDDLKPTEALNIWADMYIDDIGAETCTQYV